MMMPSFNGVRDLGSSRVSQGGRSSVSRGHDMAGAQHHHFQLWKASAQARGLRRPREPIPRGLSSATRQILHRNCMCPGFVVKDRSCEWTHLHLVYFIPYSSYTSCKCLADAPLCPWWFQIRCRGKLRSLDDRTSSPNEPRLSRHVP